ncbi:hypothetical protein T439DRAFT_324047 [Meredithblackwellia eburnea MCA 4105]
MEMDTSFESSHVHSVYDAVAKDFSRTRHKKWPFVHNFISSLPDGSLVLDAGCGNGKYLSSHSVISLPPTQSSPDIKGKGKQSISNENGHDEERGRLLLIGLDMSIGLLEIAANRGHQVVRGDCFNLSCWRRGTFDHAISIATIHHFSSEARRVQAIKQLILTVRPPKPTTTTTSTITSTSSLPSKILISVWSLEQDPSLSGVGSARRPGKKGTVPIDDPTLVENVQEQDVFVPWSLQPPMVKTRERLPRPKKGEKVASRRRTRVVDNDDDPRDDQEPLTKELDELKVDDGGKVGGKEDGEGGGEKTVEVFNRYYHLFRHGELSRLVRLAAEDEKVAGVFVQEPAADEDESSEKEGQGEWKLHISLEGGEERWERENWAVEINVRWAWVRKTPSPNP